MAERCFIYRFVNDESRRHGTTEYRRRKCVDGRVQGGGVVWRPDDVDGWPVESLRFDLHTRGMMTELTYRACYKTQSLELTGESTITVAGA